MASILSDSISNFLLLRNSWMEEEAKIFTKSAPRQVKQRRNALVERNLSSKDLNKIRKVGIKRGFSSRHNERLECYSVLLGCGIPTPKDFVTDQVTDPESKESTTAPIKYKSKYSKQIEKDINRIAYLWWDITADLPKDTVAIKLSGIQQLLDRTFATNPDLNYVQSLDSVFAVFYIISEENLKIAERLIVKYLHIMRSDWILSPEGIGDLPSLWKVLRRHDKRLCQRILSFVRSEEDLAWALRWYISWFIHSNITEFAVILRVFDFMLSTQDPSVGLYMITAVLISCKSHIEHNVRNNEEFLTFVQSLKMDRDDVESVIVQCRRIMEQEKKWKVQDASWKEAKRRVRKRVKRLKQPFAGSKPKSE